MTLRYLSVCSGIEAATAAWHPLGWEPAAFSEIAPFPSAVLAHRFPNVPNLGDMEKYKEWDIGPVQLLVGGTPCQSFSIAGLRKGMADPRGNLALVFLGIAARLRPAWVVWENVPGVRSSGGGRDFGSVLGGLAELGYGWAYRSLDAQYFGVAQRRERVFVVGCLGDWRRAAAVLLERESLSWHPAPSRETGQGVAPTIAARTRGGGGLGTDFDCDGGLIPQTAKPGMKQQTYVAFQSSQSGMRTGDTHATLDANNGSRRHHGAVTPMGVRRLTPRECERLQGFPDDWTLVPYRGKLAADGPRYSAIGNSMAVPVMRWIGERIRLVGGLTGQGREAAG